MSTEIRIWQIHDDGLRPLATTMAETGRNEPEDLQRWIRTAPSILGGDVLIIGEQVQTRSGPMDFLGIDSEGNTVVVEVKRDRVPREALAQAIDYASDAATWDLYRLNEECLKYRKQPLDDYLNENLQGIALEDLTLNESQRILLVGAGVEEALQRMIEWLSGRFGVGINAVLFTYVRTKSGDELLAKTTIIPEQVEEERRQRQAGRIPMSDEPGSYEDDELHSLLATYLAGDGATPRRMRRVLLPLCLDHEPVTRDDIKQELIKQGEAKDERQAGLVTATMSGGLGVRDRDYLRQVIRYDKPQPWEKENYRIEERHKGMVREVLAELDETASGDPNR